MALAGEGRGMAQRGLAGGPTSPAQQRREGGCPFEMGMDGLDGGMQLRVSVFLAALYLSTSYCTVLTGWRSPRYC